MNNAAFRNAQYVMGAAKLDQLPEDSGIEVAFAGRSNAGKSSVLNCLTDNRSLARTSKTPGRTQLINLFELGDPSKRLVDLPGYGFAKVSRDVKLNWQETLSAYLEKRACLKGLILLMDARHPLKDTDVMLAKWAFEGKLACHILLNKADKLGKNDQNKTLFKTQKSLKDINPDASIQLFSALKRQGLITLLDKLHDWFELGESSDETGDTSI